MRLIILSLLLTSCASTGVLTQPKTCMIDTKNKRLACQKDDVFAGFIPFEKSQGYVVLDPKDYWKLVKK